MKPKFLIIIVGSIVFTLSCNKDPLYSEVPVYYLTANDFLRGEFGSAAFNEDGYMLWFEDGIKRRRWEYRYDYPGEVLSGIDLINTRTDKIKMTRNYENEYSKDGKLSLTCYENDEKEIYCEYEYDNTGNLIQKKVYETEKKKETIRELTQYHYLDNKLAWAEYQTADPILGLPAEYRFAYTLDERGYLKVKRRYYPDGIISDSLVFSHDDWGNLCKMEYYDTVEKANELSFTYDSYSRLIENKENGFLQTFEYTGGDFTPIAIIDPFYYEEYLLHIYYPFRANEYFIYY